MIQRFRKVIDGLYRGSAPTPQDVLSLKNNLGIKKIISLDKNAGDKIDRTCKLLNIKHIIMPIDAANDLELRKNLLSIFKHNLKKLLIDDGPSYVHCHWGKDRTGLIIAVFKCKYMGINPEKAIEEAKSLGFGLGLNEHVVSLYEKIIRNCKKSKDVNSADIVSNVREPISDNRSSPLDEAQQSSFSPYLSETRQYPYDAVYNEINDQSPTRQNYKSTEQSEQEAVEENDKVPQVGVYNNGAGIQGAGPTEPIGGYFV